MDRLQALAHCLCLWLAISSLGCSREENAPPVQERTRFAAVPATRPITSGREWCDIHNAPGSGPRLVLPPVVTARPEESTRPLPTDRWIWLNVWATWCAPCLREMPMIDRWIEVLKADGVPVDIGYLSVDESAYDLLQFFRASPAIARKNSYRLSDQEALKPWLQGLGLKPDTAIPVNVIAGPGGQVRCVRTGSISESDFQIVKTFLKSPN